MATTNKDRLANEESYIKNIATVEAEQYKNYKNSNASIQSAVDDAIRGFLDYKSKTISDSLDKLNNEILSANSAIAEIYDQYSYKDRQKGRFSSRDKQKIKELQATIQNNRSRYEIGSKELDDLKYLSGNISGGLQQAEDSAEDQLKFGVPKNPNSKTATKTSDHYSETDRVDNYRRQQEFAHDFETLATLIGPKAAKKLSDKMFTHLYGAQIKLSHGMDEDITKTAELFKKYGLGKLPITDYRFVVNGKPTHTVDSLFRNFTSNCHSLSRLSTSIKVGDFLKWPEVDAATLRATKKNPDYHKQVVTIIDQLIERIGGIEGAEKPQDVIDKLGKMRAKSVKKLPDPTKEETVVKSTVVENTAPTKEEATTEAETTKEEATTEAVKEAPAPEIDPIAYSLFTDYYQSGTSLTFPTWCEEHKIDLPKGWQFVQEERAKGFEEYLAQQQEKAEATASQPPMEMEDEGMGM